MNNFDLDDVRDLLKDQEFSTMDYNHQKEVLNVYLSRGLDKNDLIRLLLERLSSLNSHKSRSKNLSRHGYGPNGDSFTLDINNGHLAPKGKVIDNTTGQPLRDSYVLIEKSKDRVRILGVGNWQSQKAPTVSFNGTGTTTIDAGHFIYSIIMGGEASKSSRGDYAKGVMDKALTIYEEAPDYPLDVTKAMGDLYIFIHDLSSGNIRVYKRIVGSLEAPELNATVTLNEVARGPTIYNKSSIVTRQDKNKY